MHTLTLNPLEVRLQYSIINVFDVASLKVFVTNGRIVPTKPFIQIIFFASYGKSSGKGHFSDFSEGANSCGVPSLVGEMLTQKFVSSHMIPFVTLLQIDIVKHEYQVLVIVRL